MCRLIEKDDRLISFVAGERDEHMMLKKLKPVPIARFGDGDLCTPGTRPSTLQQITTWLGTEMSPTASFWVHGTAGSGKSAIASTICKQLRAKGGLAGSLFYKRGISEQHDPRRIMRSLSYMLAIMVEPYRDLLLKALEKEPDIPACPLSLQLTTLFITPFSTLQELDTLGRPSLPSMQWMNVAILQVGHR